MGVPRHAHWLSSNSSVINHLVGEESSKIQGINECDYFVIQELQFLVYERLSVGGFFFFIALMIIETITYIDRDSASATFVLHNFSLCVLCGSRWCSVVVMVCARSPRCGMGGDTCATSCFVARTRTHPITLTHTHARMMPQHRGIPRACKGHRHIGDRESCSSAPTWSSSDALDLGWPLLPARPVWCGQAGGRKDELSKAASVELSPSAAISMRLLEGGHHGVYSRGFPSSSFTLFFLFSLSL